MKSKSTVLTLILIMTFLVVSPNERAQGTITVASERVVIDGYNEPNTPPNVPISPQLAEAITDPAAKNPDGTVNLNKAIYVRFFDANRAASTPPRFIVVMFADVGANSLSILASEVVKASRGDVELWAVDRRSNLLEDATAMIQAERLATKEAAMAALNAYINHPAGPGGYITNHPFELSPFMAEWGLDVHLRDLKAVVERAAVRVGSASRVFLGGGSIGAPMAQAFAAYNFEGVAGYRLLGGLILLDFTLAPGTGLIRFDPISDDLYLNGGFVPDDLLNPLIGQALAGLRNLRNPQRRFDLNNPGAIGHEPFQVDYFVELADNPQGYRLLPIGPVSYQMAEIAAQLALWDRDGTTPFGPPYVPVRATNEAALGFLFDDEFQNTLNSRWSIGFVQVPPGGSVKDVTVRVNDSNNPNGLFAPKDLGSTPQRWAALRDLAAIKLKGKEPTEFQAFARAFLYGSGQPDLTRRLPNFLDWYLSQRLLLDLLGLAVTLDATKLSAAVKSAMMAKGGRVLALTENKKVNVPVLALRAGQGLVPSVFFLSASAVFSTLLGTYRASTSIPSSRMKIKASQLPDFAYGDLFTSREKGTEGKSVADYIVDFVNGRL